MNERPEPLLLHGRLALVTGAAGGIGRAIALRYARAGARVLLADLRAADCAAAVREIADAGGSAWAFALDITDVPACAALAERVGREIGPLDVLVNNAGILLREGIDTPEAHRKIRHVFDVNVMGGFNLLHAFLPALRQTRGCVVNIASGAAFIAQAGCIGYSGSKGAVKMLTQSMAVDLAPDGIRVNAIAPGVIETAMTDATRADPQRLQGFLRRTPLGRVGQPEEIAEPALFLASPMASYITGVTLPVDGGVLAA
ncbi:SDR family NAD(P)-dependent oxidoreductase [Variovorax sp. J22P271]|uniref:SDR family NAD(P)-dependent oxidoreductase n=1 Tax=Variovorax davisae TaxID=3053515 RepID=UPI0025755280|nr:SDR family NAD(P)-dependent oxidoreductase [Variovorax sp. J22P271]MDM0035661.1 SDR family NAD(P)-dependent oxidoreductase [Variovorax sp. J22P271]